MTTDSIKRAQGGAGVPRADAFYFPADTARQACLWLAWPQQDPVLQTAVAAVAGAAAAFAPVTLLVTPGQETRARAACGAVADIIALPHHSLRLRDTGPTFLVDGKGGSAAVDWRFNGWGNGAAGDDATLAHALLGTAEVRRFRAPLTLEGSNFASDGRGTLLALAPAVFDPARNTGITPLEAFGIFQEWLGTARVVWIDACHPGDALGTDLRALAAFAAPGVVMVSAPPQDKAAGDISVDDKDVATQIGRVRDALGNTLSVVSLPAPPAGTGPLSYTNVLPVNGGLLVPAFDGADDVRACDILAELFPEHVICPVPARALAAAGVTLTSLALPQPARLLERDRATVLPRSAWSQPALDAEEMMQRYSDMASDNVSNKE